MQSTTITTSRSQHEHIQFMLEENSQWLRWIRSWKTILRTIYHNLHEKEKKNPFPSTHLALLDKEIIALAGEQFEEVEKMVRRHALHLQRILTLSEDTKRTSCDALHLQLYYQVEQLKELFQQFLKKVSAITKHDFTTGY